MKKPVIMCVDDEQMVLVSLKSQLKRYLGNDYMIETVESGEEAIEVFNEYMLSETPVPLVISDQIMPGMKGDEFLKEIHKRSDRTLKILLTGQASAEAIGNAVNNASLYRYIAKPWEQTDLNLTVMEAVRSFHQNMQLEEQNRLLKDYTEKLEEKIEERTQEINKQKAELEVRNKDITDSISYASRIQNSFLPQHSFIAKHLPESFVFYKPRDIVSGDFYWFSVKEHRKIMIVADCTGHGVPGGFMSIIGNNLLNEIINKEKTYSPGDILQQLDIRIKKILNQGVTQNNDGMDISICVYDSEARTIEYSGANNAMFYIENSVAKQLKPNKRSIGGFFNIAEKDSGFKSETITVTGPTTVYLYTDGFADQFGGEKDKKFLRKNFYDLLYKNHHKPFPEQKELIEKAFREWKRDQYQNDDVLVFGFSLK